MSDRVRVMLDGAALRNNAAVVRQLAPEATFLAVVKSDAYGHGVAFALRHLADRVDGFAVASVDEALALRRAGAGQLLWVLSDFDPADDLDVVVDYDLVPVLHDHAQLAALANASRHPAQVVVKVDSGMGRLGFAPAEVPAVLSALRDHDIAVAALASHLANADNPGDAGNRQQLDRFRAVDAGNLPRSLANSAGLVGWPESRLDIVRPGIMLYGVCPVNDRDAASLGLAPVMTLDAKILALREFAAGQPVGYGGRFRCQRPTRAAVIACGYGDGYPRSAADGTPVRLEEGIAPLIGRVSMDSLLVDVTDLGEIDRDQRVVLWGAGLPAEEVAGHCDTIAYELFCRLSARPTRVEDNVGHG